MELLKFRAAIDADGHLRLDVPTNLPQGEVELIVLRKTALTPYDFSDLAGKLKWQGDALKEQRRLRNEW